MPDIQVIEQTLPARPSSINQSGPRQNRLSPRSWRRLRLRVTLGSSMLLIAGLAIALAIHANSRRVWVMIYNSSGATLQNIAVEHEGFRTSLAPSAHRLPTYVEIRSKLTGPIQVSFDVFDLSTRTIKHHVVHLSPPSEYGSVSSVFYDLTMISTSYQGRHDPSVDHLHRF